MVRDKADRLTTDLLSWEPPPVAVGYADDVAGKGALANRIARLISRAMRDARDDNQLDRATIAHRLTDYLGRPVSEDILDKWASEAAEGNRIPLDAFVGLIHVTGATDLLGFIPGLFGFAVVPSKYEALIELQLLEEHERELQAHKTRMLARMRGQR